MDIIVCVKHVPETAEAEIRIDATGKAIERSGLVFDINEWDDYAVEEALLLREKHGGTVTIITVGPESADDALRKCLGRGADKAIRLTDPSFEGSDGYAVAKILYGAIGSLSFDLVLTGAQAADDGYAMVGPVLAALLKVRHATMVKKIVLEGGVARVNRELEGGLEEIVEARLPAVLTIQTGINEPRYVSIMALRKAMQKEIRALGLADIGIEQKEIGQAGSWMRIENMFAPPVEKQAELLTGSPEGVATRIVEILRSRGLI